MDFVTTLILLAHAQEYLPINLCLDFPSSLFKISTLQAFHLTLVCPEVFYSLLLLSKKLFSPISQEAFHIYKNVIDVCMLTFLSYNFTK